MLSMMLKHLSSPSSRPSVHRWDRADLTAEPDEGMHFDLSHACARLTTLEIDVHHYSPDTLVDITVEIFSQVPPPRRHRHMHHGQNECSRQATQQGSRHLRVCAGTNECSRLHSLQQLAVGLSASASISSRGLTCVGGCRRGWRGWVSGVQRCGRLRWACGGGC
jgi:hypothetical protein